MPVSVSKSTSADNRQTATDQGIVVREGVIATTSNNLGVGQGGTLASSKSTLATNGGTVLGTGSNTGVQVQKGASVENLTVGDGGKTAETLAQTLSSTSAGLQSTLQSAIGKLGEKDQLNATDGTGSKNIIFLVLGVVGLLVVALYFLRK